MLIFDFLALLDPEVVPAKTKIHLATPAPGGPSPLDAYFAGEFPEWQSWQTKRNFERPFVLSLIGLSGAHRWLFAGLYDTDGADRVETKSRFQYHLTERTAASEMEGHLIARFARAGRQSYLNAETWKNKITIDEVLPQRLAIAEFPGYKAIDLSKADLDIIVRQGLESWRAALSSVAGVYLISDMLSGKLYVGSATGEGGIWQRWVQYAETGHGGNTELKALLKGDGARRADAFHFSVLEIADTHTQPDEVVRRETHWKRVLLTREHGLNAN